MGETVQLAISDAAFRDELMRMLSASDGAEVVCVDNPDPARSGVLVVDPEHLNRLALPLPRPERVVVVTDDSPGHMEDTLDHAWRAGVHSVVSTREPVGTAVLAVLSARLRMVKQLPSQRKERRLP